MMIYVIHIFGVPVILRLPALGEGVEFSLHAERLTNYRPGVANGGCGGVIPLGALVGGIIHSREIRKPPRERP